MSDDARRAREEKAALDLIRAKQGLAGTGASKSDTPWWTLSATPERLALEGVFLFGIAFLVGCGLAVFYTVITST